MASGKDTGRGIERAEAIDLSDPAAIQRRIAELTAARDALLPEGMEAAKFGTRMEQDDHGNEPKEPAPPKGAKAGHWEPVQAVDTNGPPAHYAHEQVWVEHHGMGNGRWMDGQLMRWVEDAA
jgi:hypothetical protein